MYTEAGELRPVPPFDFEKSLQVARSFWPNQYDQHLAEDSLLKAFSVNGQPVLVQVRSAGIVEEPRLRWRLFAPAPLPEKVRAQAVDQLAFYLSLDDDLRPFYDAARQDAEFAPIMADLYGYHQVKFISPFESACWAVISQRNHFLISRRMKAALAGRWGSRITHDGVEYVVFPEPARLVNVQYVEMLDTIRHRQKTEYLLEVIDAFNAVDDDFLRSTSADTVEKWLRSIHGIGAWSAAFIMLRGLGQADRLPADDPHLQEIISRLYLHGKPPTKEDIRRLTLLYGPWKGYWAHYLRVGA